jgi:competence protein ComEC
MRCYLWKDERSRSLQLGDALVIDDYQGPFVRSRNWQQGGEARQQLSRWQRLRLWFLQERHRLLDRYQALNGDEAAYAVLAAMTLGDKSALTPELRETYSVSGASHVLALSGLHLGIIYMLLTWLSMGRRRYWLSQLLMVTAIWAFALLTGLSPSITRSATMISLYALFSTRSNGRVSLNIICFTAIVMLLADAHALFEVSFQLSFMAVLSIVTLMPLWNRVWQPRHPVANWLWQLTSMSVSAQLGVAPLIAFHFGRFSTYFLLTNFLVIPAATIIIYGAVLMLVTPSVGSALIWFVWQLNDALSVIAKLPYASIDGLHPSAAQVGIIYALTAIFCRIIYILTNAGYRSGWPRSSRG